MSAIAVAELRYGADKSARPKANHELLDAFLADVPAVDFSLRAASEYGRLRAALERAGTPIGPNDMLIAAQALALGAVVVTDNDSEFRRVPGLRGGELARRALSYDRAGALTAARPEAARGRLRPAGPRATAAPARPGRAE